MRPRSLTSYDQLTEGGPEIDKILKEDGEMELKSAFDEAEVTLQQEKNEEFTLVRSPGVGPRIFLKRIFILGSSGDDLWTRA